MYQSNLPAVAAKLRAARFAGLVAAANVVVNAVKEGLRGGYTSGAFVTGFVLNSVTNSEPAEDANGAFILVGSNVNSELARTNWQRTREPLRASSALAVADRSVSVPRLRGAHVDAALAGTAKREM